MPNLLSRLRDAAAREAGFVRADVKALPWADVAVVAGYGLLALGAAQVYAPLGLIVAGVGLLATVRYGVRS